MAVEEERAATARAAQPRGELRPPHEVEPVRHHAVAAAGRLRLPHLDVGAERGEAPAQVLLQLRLLPRGVADVARRGVEPDQVARERHELLLALAHGSHHAFLERRSKGLAHGSSSGWRAPTVAAGRASRPARPKSDKWRLLQSGTRHSGGSSPKVTLTSTPCFLLMAFQTKYQVMPATHAATNRISALRGRGWLGSKNE